VLVNPADYSWRRKIFRVVFLQGILTVLLGLVGIWAGSVVVGKSAFIGGVIAVLPSYYLASRMSVSYPEKPIASLKRIYLGAFIKILYTLVLFGLAIKYLDIQFVVMISSYFVVTLTNWFSLRFLDLSEQG
jgi:F0F1-type ATP synthase assembly protein I